MAINNSINPRLIESNNQALTSSESVKEAPLVAHILDTAWAKQAFLINDDSIGNVADVKNRYISSAAYKFTDTRLGASIGINARPQFTPYCDVPDKGKMADRSDVTISDSTGNFGMGSYYSEAIDDNAQRVYLRFGKPQYNSLLNFLTKAFDPELTSLANTGKGTSAFYKLAKAAATVATVVAFPTIAVPILAAKVLNAAFARPVSKFYTLKPTMHLYWGTVNLLVNTLAINKGIFPKIVNDLFGNPADAQNAGRPFKLDEEQIQNISDAFPEIFRSQRLYDMYALANHAQRLANKRYSDDYNAADTTSVSDFTGYLERDLTGTGTHGSAVQNKDGSMKIGAVVDEALKGSTISKALDLAMKVKDYFSDTGQETMATDSRIGADGKPISEKGPYDAYVEFLDSEFRDGAAFAIFQVDHTGAMNESFNNSVTEPEISSTLNSASSKARQVRFAFSEGNVLGDVVSTVAGAATDTLSGAISGATFGFSDFIKGMFGNGYIDIPKVWQDSSANMTKGTYAMTLISPYGNPFSIMQNIYIPLCMLLAGALPLSTGKASYSSPFLCQLFDRGRCQIRLGMIESISITRGVSHLAFDHSGNPLAIRVEFTVADLSSIMHVPVSTGEFLTDSITLDEDNNLSDYLAVLAGQDIYSQIYPSSKLKLYLAKKLVYAGQYTSAAHWASFVHEYMPFTSIYEGMVRGTSLTNPDGF